MDRVRLCFQGFFKDYDYGWEAAEEMPRKEGIYCVYRAPLLDCSHILFPRELLYIGETPDFRTELSRSRSCRSWRQLLTAQEGLYYTFAPLSGERDRAWAAMVFKHKPLLNQQYRHNFPFESTEVSLLGRTPLLKGHFRVPDDTTVQTSSIDAVLQSIWLAS